MVSMGPFEVLVELFDVHTQRSGEAPLTVPGTACGCNVFPGTEMTTRCGLMVECSYRDPMQYKRHPGRIGGSTQFAAQGTSELHIQRAG